MHRPAPQAKRGAGRFCCVSAHPRDATCSHLCRALGNLMCTSAPYGFIASPRSIPRLDWDFPPIHVVPHSTGFPQRGHTPSPDIALQQMRETIAAKRNEGRCREGGSSTAREGRARSKRPVRRGDGGQTDRDHRGARGGALNREKVPRLAARAVKRRRLPIGKHPEKEAFVWGASSAQQGVGEVRRSPSDAGRPCPFRVENGSRDVASRP